MLKVAAGEAANPQIIDFENSRLVFVYGSVSYYGESSASSQFVSETEMQIDASKFGPHKTPVGSYALIVTPLRVDGIEAIESVVRDRVREVVGLAGAFYGRNVAYQHLFDNILNLENDQTSFFGPVMQNPNWFDSVDISALGITPLAAISVAISALPDKDKNRTQLSLRWFHYAQFDTDGVSSFIKFWVAIETLAMPNTSNIKPLNLALAKGYNLKITEAETRFQMGRVLNLRSKIVHDGLIVPIHGQLLRYMEAVFVDLLMIAMGVPIQCRAETVISDPKCELASYLKVK